MGGGAFGWDLANDIAHDNVVKVGTRSGSLRWRPFQPFELHIDTGRTVFGWLEKPEIHKQQLHRAIHDGQVLVLGTQQLSDPGVSGKRMARIPPAYYPRSCRGLSPGSHWFLLPKRGVPGVREVPSNHGHRFSRHAARAWNRPGDVYV